MQEANRGLGLYGLRVPPRDRRPTVRAGDRAVRVDYDELSFVLQSVDGQVGTDVSVRRDETERVRDGPHGFRACRAVKIDPKASILDTMPLSV